MLCKRTKTPEQVLFDTFQSLKIEPYKKTVLQERYLSVLRNFHSRAINLGYFYYISRVIMTVGSILVPAFLSIQGSTPEIQIYWATWIISLSVTISNGFMTLFKLDKKYFFINTTLEMLHSEGWQYIGLSGRYAPKDILVPSTHENQFLIFFHMAEKIKMRQVEEEYWKFTDTSGVGNATNQKHTLISPTPVIPQGSITSLPEGQRLPLEQWVGDLNSNMLGLQPRARNLLNKVDGKNGTSRISGSSSNPTMPMSSELSKRPSSKGTMVQISQTNESTPEAEIPENSLIQVLYQEPDQWSGTPKESRSLE